MPVEKRNIFLHETQHALPYVSKRKRSDASFPCRENPKAHAAFILQKLEACRQQDYDQKQVAAIRHKEGIYLEFSGAAGYDLLTKSFDNYSSGIRLLNVREDGQDDEKIVRATVYVPAEKTTYFLDKIQSYSESLDTLEAGQNPKNDSLVRSIEDVKLALLEAFWVGKVEDIPSDVPAWCEIWLRYEKSDHAAAEQDLSTCCEEFGIELNSKCIVFPERVVRLVRGTRTQLSMLLEGCNYLAEIRRAQEPTSFFDELTGSEQKEWVNDLLSRTEFHPSSASVCILDFKKRVNVKMRGDDKADSGDGSSGSERWFLGSDNRDVGSIHSDFIKATAAELSQAKYLAVYPVVGWWRERSYLGKVESKIRYSLIVSISTPDVSVDLYTPIVAQINNPIEVEIPTE